MKRARTRYITALLVAAAIVIAVWLLLGIGFAAIVAVGLVVLLGILLPGKLIVEDVEHEPSWEGEHPPRDHGYHPSR